MALTGRTAYRLGGYTIADEDIDNDANIKTSKQATRTLRLTIPATAFVLKGAGCVKTYLGVFGAVTMPDANISELYMAIPKPCEYVSGDITIRILWSTAATSGNLKLTVVYKGIISGDTMDTGGTTVTATDAASGTTLLLNEITLTITAADITNDDLITFYIERDPANGSDTLGADIKVYAVSLEFTGRG